MILSGRILRYFLEVLAIGSVLLIPAGCDPSTLSSQIADDGSPVNGAPGGTDDDDAGGAADDGDPAQPGVAEVPGGGGEDAAAGDGDADPASPGDDLGAGDDTPDEPSGDDDVPDDGGNDDPPPDDSGDDDAPPDDDGGGDDPPPDDGGGDDSPQDDGGGGDDPPPDDGGGDDPPSDPEVPSNDYCDPVADWSEAWRAYEAEVLALVNERRAAGAECGSYGTFAAAGPLTFDPALRCAARAHSMDMGERDFFSHTNPDGEGPGQRLSYAGYGGFGWGENIAWGYMTPAAVVAGWMSSPGHCANIMRPQWTLIGVGYYEGNIWTQTFGAN